MSEQKTLQPASAQTAQLVVQQLINTGVELISCSTIN